MLSLNTEFVNPHVNFVVEVIDGIVSDNFCIIAGSSSSDFAPDSEYFPSGHGI